MSIPVWKWKSNTLITRNVSIYPSLLQHLQTECPIILISAYLYRDCGYELLKNAPCRDCKPGVADADFGFVVVNKTTYDFDRNGKWNVSGGDSCSFVFLRQSRFCPNVQFSPFRPTIGIVCWLDGDIAYSLFLLLGLFNTSRCSSILCGFHSREPCNACPIWLEKSTMLHVQLNWTFAQVIKIQESYTKNF